MGSTTDISRMGTINNNIPPLDYPEKDKYSTSSSAVSNKPYLLGTAQITTPTIYKGLPDVVLKFWDDNPKFLAQTLRYTCEWALIFFKSLAEFNPLTRAAYALKQVNTWFNWQEEVRSIYAIRKTVSNYFYPPENPIEKPTKLMKVFEDSCDLVSKTCELFRWFVESKIFAISARLASSMLLLNGVTMMISFSQKINDSLGKLEKCPYEERNVLLWKTAKYISLFAIGVILTIAFFNGLNYAPILFCSTISLLANYAQALIERSSCDASVEKFEEDGNTITAIHLKRNDTPNSSQSAVDDMVVRITERKKTS